jgi:hypothetical protein
LRALSPLIAIFVAVTINYNILSKDHHSSKNILEECQCTVPTLLDHYTKIIAIQKKFELLASDECTADKDMVELYENHYSLLRLILERPFDVTERSRKYCIAKAPKASDFILCEGRPCGALRARITQNVKKPSHPVNVIDFEFFGFNVSICVPWSPLGPKKS